MSAARPTTLHAIVREVSSSLPKCQITHIGREPIDIELARRQHEAYCAEILRLPPLDDLPDACFIEDAAIVLPEVAIITRMGSPARRAETAGVEPALRPFRRMQTVPPPGMIDGGDVLRMGRTLCIGRSTRSSRDGIETLRHIAEPLGYRVIAIEVRGCLHLKTACTGISPETLLVNPDWVDPAAFRGLHIINIPIDEPWAANALTINGSAIMARGHPRTADLLAKTGLSILPVDLSEFQKAEAGATCLSLIVEG